VTTAVSIAEEELDRFLFRRRTHRRIQAVASVLSTQAADLLLTGAADPRRRIQHDDRFPPFLATSELIRHGCLADEGRLTGHGIAVAERLEELLATAATNVGEEQP
jgi:hypothetical protein